MSDPQQVRPEVVDTIFAVLKGADPAELPADATREEKDAAKDRYLSEVVAERSKRDRQAQAWELLLTRGYDEPPTWQRLFDDLGSDLLRIAHGVLPPVRRPAWEPFPVGRHSTTPCKTAGCCDGPGRRTGNLSDGGFA